MKDLTREIIRHYKDDLQIGLKTNNTRDRKRTPEQREQSHRDMLNHYRQKWEALQKEATTPAQKKYCAVMLDHIEERSRTR